MKLHEYTDCGAGRLFAFHCPGCGYAHHVHVGYSHRQSWVWNGSFAAPTFSPSLLVWGMMPKKRCHSFVADGKIQFLTDSFHKLAGQTVELPEWV